VARRAAYQRNLARSYLRRTPHARAIARKPNAFDGRHGPGVDIKRKKLIMPCSLVRVSVVTRASLLAAPFVTGMPEFAARAAAQISVPAHRHEAPVGHRQPNPATVPGSPNQPSMTLEDPEIDRKLNICRGC
jgi:hypothetical protein